MALTPPPDSQSSYYPPALLSWRIQEAGVYIEIPLSIELCDALKDEDIAAIGETVEVRLKACYPESRISRVLSWKPSAPAAETQTVVQEGQPPAPSPDQPAPEEPPSDEASADTPPPDQGQ